MVRDVILAEELFLLTHDDESGKAKSTVSLDQGLAGALLLDLAAEELLVAQGKEVVAVDGTASHPLLDAALAEIRSSDRPRKVDHWVGRLPPALSPLGTAVGRSLAERGILAEERRKTLGLFTTTRWPEVDAAPERALRDRLAAVLAHGAEPDLRTALLVCLLLPLDLVTSVADGDKRAAKARAEEIAESGVLQAGVSAAVSTAVLAVQTAVLTAVFVPVMISTTT